MLSSSSTDTSGQANNSMRKCFSLIEDLMEHDSMNSQHHHHQSQFQHQNHQNQHVYTEDQKAKLFISHDYSSLAKHGSQGANSSSLPSINMCSGGSLASSVSSSSGISSSVSPSNSFKNFLIQMNQKPDSASSSSNNDEDLPSNGTRMETNSPHYVGQQQQHMQLSEDNLVPSLHSLQSSLPLLITSTHLLDNFGEDNNNLNSINFDVDFLSEDSILYQKNTQLQPQQQTGKLLGSIDPNMIRFKQEYIAENEQQQQQQMPQYETLVQEKSEPQEVKEQSESTRLG